MPERARYIPGVPCWIDTNQPAPEAAAAFYSGLFDWKVEDVMPAGSEVNYFIARIRGGDVAGIGPIPSAPRRSRPRSATRDRAAGPCLFFCSPPSDPPSKAARARPFERHATPDSDRAQGSDRADDDRGCRPGEVPELLPLTAQAPTERDVARCDNRERTWSCIGASNPRARKRHAISRPDNGDSA